MLFIAWTIGNVYLGGTYYILTDSRAIRYNENLLSSDLEYVDLANVSNIDVEKGITGGIFDTGKVDFEAPRADDVEFPYLARPYDVMDTCQEYV